MKAQALPAICLAAVWLLAGCHRQPQPPPSAYDKELLDTARRIAEENRRRDEQARQQAAEPKPQKVQCSRETGGCQPGYICWDSYFCKRGFDDQCTASGDKRCHKLCDTDEDCPRSMPKCRAKPMFSGSEEGREVTFCVEQ